MVIGVIVTIFWVIVGDCNNILGDWGWLHVLVKPHHPSAQIRVFTLSLKILSTAASLTFLRMILQMVVSPASQSLRKENS